MNQEVSDYIARQQPLQKAVCEKLRAIILKTFPGITEEMKLGVPWYQGKYYIVALKDHVNLGFSLQDLSAAEARLFQGSGKTMKHIKIYSTEEIDEAKVVKLLRIVK